MVPGFDIAVTLAAATATPTLARIPIAQEAVLDHAALLPPGSRSLAYVPLALDPFARARLIVPARSPGPQVPPLRAAMREPDGARLRWALPLADFDRLRLDLSAAQEVSPSLYRTALLAENFGTIRTGGERGSARMMVGFTLYITPDDRWAQRWGLAGPVGRALVKIYDATDGGVE